MQALQGLLRHVQAHLAVIDAVATACRKHANPEAALIALDRVVSVRGAYLSSVAAMLSEPGNAANIQAPAAPSDSDFERQQAGGVGLVAVLELYFAAKLQELKGLVACDLDEMLDAVEAGQQLAGLPADEAERQPADDVCGDDGVRSHTPPASDCGADAMDASGPGDASNSAAAREAASAWRQDAQPSGVQLPHEWSAKLSHVCEVLGALGQRRAVSAAVARVAQRDVAAAVAGIGNARLGVRVIGAVEHYMQLGPLRLLYLVLPTLVRLFASFLSLGGGPVLP